jgi:G protein-coupled receptor kinase
MIFLYFLIQVKREEVERRVKDEQEKYSNKFNDDAKAICQAVRSLNSFNY